MSKQATLATCIAKMYEGAKVDQAKAASETPKKASPTLLGSLNAVEHRLAVLEGRVDQMTGVQTAVLQKLDSVCQGLRALDQSMAQLRQDVLRQPTVKSTHEDTGQGRDNPAACTEVRALCGEMVLLLKSLNHEGQQQRKEMEGIDSSVSRLEKAFGCMGDAFHSSKIMEFFLSGVVPWKKQGRLDVTEEEEIKGLDESTGKSKAARCHRGTQTPKEINDEATAVLHEHREEKITCCAPDCFNPEGSAEETQPLGKPQRSRVKEVTLKSREPGRVQAFTQSQHESKMTQFQEVLPPVTVTITTISQPEMVSHTEDPAIRVQHTKDPAIRVEHTKDPAIRVEHTKDPAIRVQHTKDPAIRFQHTKDPAIRVEHTKDPAIRVEHTKDPAIRVEHTKDPAIRVQHAKDPAIRVQHTKDPAIRFQHTKDPAIRVEHTKDPAIRVEHTKDPAIRVEHTKDPAIRVEHTPASSESQRQEGVEQQRKEMEREEERVCGESCEQRQGDFGREPWSSKQNMPVKQNLESGVRQKEVVALATPQTGTKPEPVSKVVAEETKPNSADLVLEEPVMVQEDSNPSSDTSSPAFCNATQPEAASQSQGSSSLLIIDDCPPQPAPFEHRIVSAKQVPIDSYYAVRPNEVLGGGRFGQVHKCAELSSGLTLAAKIIKVKGMKERDEVKNEIGVMNQLNHVNLIQLYDAFESRTNLTLIMEYVEGGELFDRIVDEQYQLTELEAIVFMRQICEGVQYLHQQYILHLDLKPENILCVSNTGNQIKIIDFGLARKYRPREKLKVNFGTPEFLAPEVVNYDFVSFPTDMWSVGVITYMLLSGLSPFLGETDTETMNNILHANWDFDAEAFENVSEEAKDFISKLLVTTKCDRLSAAGCLKHSWLNNLEDKAKRCRVRLKSHLKLQRYLAAHRQWKKHFYAVAAANRLKRFQQSRCLSTP
ncbi:myosin light chain kinase 3 [Brachyhypopomus gauderio]|uniref:myosin light chain kinase 3 n=1 Tax=Brachyhypopomus gauderio TaxID=698409 RepID=UPI0040434219